MSRIPRAVVDEMVAHAREELPNEACGMVHAKDGAPVAVHRVPNHGGGRDEATGQYFGSPYRYVMDAREMFKLERQRDKDDELLFAIYHSHVASPAYPSPTDVRLAFFPPPDDQFGFDREPAYPETMYILVSLASEPPDVRAFWIRRGGEVVEEPIEIT